LTSTLTFEVSSKHKSKANSRTQDNKEGEIFLLFSWQTNLFPYQAGEPPHAQGETHSSPQYWVML